MAKSLKTNESWRERQHAASDRTVKRFAVGLVVGLGLFVATAITYMTIIAPYNSCGYEFRRDFLRTSKSQPTNSSPARMELDLLKPYFPSSNQIRQ